MELSGHEWQRAEYGSGGAKWAQREGQGGVARTLLYELTALFGSPTLGDLVGGGQFSLICGEEGQLSKCLGVGGGILPSGQPQLIT